MSEFTRCVKRIRLRPEVYLATGADGQLALLHGNKWGERLGALSDAELAVLRELADRPRLEAEVAALLGPGSTLLRRLHSGGWLTVHYGHQNRRLVTVRPLGPHREPRPSPPAAPRLSRFALLRRDGDTLVLESPRARAVIEVHDLEVVAVLHHLATGTEPHTRLPRPVVAELIEQLAWYGFVHDAEEDARPDLATEQWSPHELWFHARSRAGYHELPFGGTLWAAERHPPLPARREPWSGTAIPLPKPPADAPPGPSFTSVLESRRSVRDTAGAAPLTLEQLGEFLHRVGHVRRVAVDGRHEVSLRPSPSGGALHALELYPVITSVTGVASGMYHYDPFDHVLEPVPASEFVTGQLIARAAAGAGGSPPPHVLLVIAARFGRVMWKYQSMAYALILKDAGALLQTMYLVATAMNLAPCALGSGDVELFAQATALNPLVEASVAEFMLANRRP
jgi:SagB-type dehydrogenase family enzyme